jgi:hypothetical protein
LYFSNVLSCDNNDRIFTDFSTTNWPAFNEYFDVIDWSSVYDEADDGDCRWSKFSQVLNNAVFLFSSVSVKHVRTTAIHSYPRHIRKLISKKRFIWRKANKFKTTQLFNAYRDCARNARKAIYEYTCSLEMKLVDSDNLGSFYRYVNKKLSCCCGVGCLERPDGTLSSDSKEKAELLNNFFASVFTVDDGLCPKLSMRVPTGVGLSSVSFTESRISAKLRKLKTTTASGPDGIQAILLKNARDSLSLPLADLYNFLFNLQCVPNAWKLARVTPIFKKGKPSDVSNYRPISLTSLCCKVMESIIKDDLLYYLLSKGLISRHQHGFLSRRSTGTQLLDCLNDWPLNIERKESLDVIYIDFAKAFDSVVHNKLISKLESYGIGGSLLFWINNFLFDRLQFVQIDGFCSNTVHVVSGVPQGSVLGPILFIIYVNDVCDLIVGNTSCKLYADDIKLYCTVDFNGISNELISTLDNVCQWSHIWQLNVNVKKCNVNYVLAITLSSMTISWVIFQSLESIKL